MKDGRSREYYVLALDGKIVDWQMRRGTRAISMRPECDTCDRAKRIRRREKAGVVCRYDQMLRREDKDMW